MSEQMYVIHKGGRGYYRPNAEGYTMNQGEAGRYTLAEAESHSHPNGPDGPRDGITFHAAPHKPEPTHTFPLGTRVTKIKGSSWTGRVVGHYSSSLTAEGVVVESEREPGSCQLYPNSAMRAMGDDE